MHQSIRDKVREGVAEAPKELKTGHALHPETTMGPMISAAQRDKVMGFLDQGKAEGAETVTGGRVLSCEG